uniref:Uncharacterized protein n=1 Tax=Cannabis sativa TaxID=3483 RepID=A0A803P562_CANSA
MPKPLDDREPGVDQVEAPVAEPVADRDERSSNSESTIEEVMLVQRRQYKNHPLFLKNFLDSYEEDRCPLNILSHLSEFEVNHVLEEDAKPQVLDYGEQQNWWISPPSAITTRHLTRLRKVGWWEMSDALVVEETYLGGGRTPNMDADIPLSKIERTMERKEMALHQRLAHEGTIGKATLSIRLGGQEFARPTCPLPTSRGKGKAAAYSSDDSSSEDDGS